MSLERRGLRIKRGFAHEVGKMGQEAMSAWGLTPGALFHELFGPGLNWEVAAN